MGSLGVSASTSNYSVNLESYIFNSTIETIESVKDRIVLIIYAIVLLLSVIQTFWNIKYIDRALTFITKAYSDGKLESNQVCFHHQLITCYRYDQRFSHIPNPNRIILLIIAIHIHVLMMIVTRTLFIRRTDSVNDCMLFRQPYRVLECENNRDPCALNDTSESFPKCSYYYFEMNNIITMVTSVVTWHYALCYFVVKIVCFIRWRLFRGDDQPRMLCCYFRGKRYILSGWIYLHYVILWAYLFSMVLLGFVWNINISRLPTNILGSIGIPIIITIDRLCSLILAIVPETLQNWLDATNNDEVLEDLQTKGLLLANTNSLIHLINKKTKFATLAELHATQTLK
ncbi:unnamed protein product [Rotaria sordida]|uniref:Uncharacterized protein n=1 Tax=Rotaria sordida TaxID=392033 RepID=A0A815KRQ0_9BILA|nr:unnamed protein product [Rotaria sordida]